jgi:hypothetical protein
MAATHGSSITDGLISVGILPPNWNWTDWKPTIRHADIVQVWIIYEWSYEYLSMSEIAPN